MRTLPFYTRIALLGIAMYLAIEIVIFVATLAFLRTSDLWYPLLMGGLALAGGACIFAWRPWGLIVGVAGGVVGILFSLDGLAENISSPDSFFDFAYRPVVWAGGTVLVLVGSVAGLVRHFRHRTSTRGPAAVMRGAQGLIGIVALVALVSAVLTVAGIDHLSDDERAGATVVTVEGWDFGSETITVASADRSKLVIDNKDGNVHTFTVDGLDLDKRLGPFSDTLIVFDAPAPGRYEFHCRISGHENMRGTLVVE